MRMYVLFALVAGLLLAADSAKDKEKELVKKDREFFKGAWKYTEMTRSGEKTDKDQLEALTVTYDAEGKWTVDYNGSEVLKGTSKIDPTKKPKTIDITYENESGDKKELLGIYEIKGESYRLCYSDKGERPKEFESKEDSGCTLVMTEREKKKEEKKK